MQCDNGAVDEPELRNPFRSERDAFRLLILIALGVLAVVVAAAVGGGWVGFAVAVVLLAIAGRATYRWLRISVGRPGDAPEPR